MAVARSPGGEKEDAAGRDDTPDLRKRAPATPRGEVPCGPRPPFFSQDGQLCPP